MRLPFFLLGMLLNRGVPPRGERVQQYHQEDYVLVWRNGNECRMVQEELRNKGIPFFYVNADEDMTCRVLLNSDTEDIVKLPILILDGKVVCDSVFDIYAFLYND
jgi:hypothetical protein